MTTQATNGAVATETLERSSRNRTRRQPPKTVLAPVAEVRETTTDLVVRVRLQQGALELSVPKRALSAPRSEEQHHIPGSNPDATPC